MEYVVGIDAGGTKSHLALFDTTGTLIDFAHWGPLNHEVLPGSFDQYHAEMQKFVKQVLSKNGLNIEQVVSAVFGISGVDTKAQHDIISKKMSEIGFKKFTLANDAYLGIPAGCPTATGICAINGTGCTLAGINKEGKMLQIGGVGYISADYGGGGILGKEAISAVYKELFRKGIPTCLTPALFELLDITSKYDFVDRIYQKFSDGSFNIHACGRLLFDAALKNDEAALVILRNVGINYANGISCMIEELTFSMNEEINVVFAGSVFVKSKHPILIDTIKEKLKIDSPGYNIKYTLLKVPPVAGAVFWAFNNLNIDDKVTYYNKICAQLL